MQTAILFLNALAGPYEIEGLEKILKLQPNMEPKANENLKLMHESCDLHQIVRSELDKGSSIFQGLSLVNERGEQPHKKLFQETILPICVRRKIKIYSLASVLYVFT